MPSKKILLKKSKVASHRNKRKLLPIPKDEDQSLKSELKINERKCMTDADYQAGMTAAIVAYQASLGGGYPTTGFSFTYTPPVTSTPPAETVAVSF